MSSVSVLIDDAEKIAAELVPASSVLGPVLGVLIQHVEKLAGAELTHLEDKLLGNAAPAANPEGTPTAVATPVETVSPTAETPAPTVPEPKPVDPALQERLDVLRSQLQETENAIKAAQP